MKIASSETARVFDAALNEAAVAAVVISDFKAALALQVRAILADCGLVIKAQEADAFAFQFSGEMVESIRSAPSWGGHVLNDLRLAEVLRAKGAYLLSSMAAKLTMTADTVVMKAIRVAKEKEQAVALGAPVGAVVRENTQPRNIDIADLQALQSKWSSPRR